jgi:hypothetical protein
MNDGITYFPFWAKYLDFLLPVLSNNHIFMKTSERVILLYIEHRFPETRGREGKDRNRLKVCFTHFASEAEQSWV